MEEPSILVDTLCVHVGPDVTGVRGKVQCLSKEDKEQKKIDLGRQEMIKEKCYLRFSTLPFILNEPYDVRAGGYDNFSLVSGAKDRSFVQVKDLQIWKQHQHTAIRKECLGASKSDNK